ncbi:unnamed protein product [Sphagnum balticum]
MLNKVTEFEYVIVGAGISGVQAALILAEAGKSFIVLEASSRLGGRIRTDTLGEIFDAEGSQESISWLNSTARLTPIEMGATWVSSDHPFMRKLMKNFKLYMFRQYLYGQEVYGV